MGIYYGVTVGVGFKVPLKKIRKLPEYEEIGYAEEALDTFLYNNGLGTLTFASAHAYDAADEETEYVLAIDSLTESYDSNQVFRLITTDRTDSPDYSLTDEEVEQVARALKLLGMRPGTRLVDFVASYMN